jgi:hypothetical protein
MRLQATRQYRADRSPKRHRREPPQRSLREIDRRRAILGETLRWSVQEIEDGEFEVIETTPAKGKNAA